MFSSQDVDHMRRALQLAKQAAAEGEVPVGALLVASDEIVAEGYNQVIKNNDPSAHAEINVLRQAGVRLQNYRLPNTTLFVTLEPCSMCAGAIINARVARVCFAAFDAKTGAVGSVINLLEDARLNHHATCHGGLLAEESATLLKQFFQARR